MRNKKALFSLVFILIMALLSSGCIFNGLFNRRPVIEIISDQIGKVGQEFSYQVIAYDPDNGELTYSLTEKPEGMQIENSTGLINWRPGEDQIGKFTVEEKVSNENSFNVEIFEMTVEDISLTSIGVSPTDMNVYVGNSKTITSITAYYDNGGSIDLSLTDCNYDSDNPNIATVNNGVITGISAGNTTITVSYTEGGITKTDTVGVTVEDISLTSIEVSPASINIYVGNSSTINSITAFYSDGSSLSIGLGSATYSSNNPGVASVNTTGRVTGVSAGAAIITVIYTEGGITKADMIGVTVSEAPKILTSITVLPSTMSIIVGNYKDINSITAHYDDESSASIGLGSASYNSNNPGIASVNTTGRVTGVSTGTATIIVSYTEGGITKSDTVNVTVSEAPKILTSITVLPSTMSMYVGDSENINSVTAHYNDGSSTSIGLGSAIYSSNNPGIASVNTTGRVTGVSVGSTTITISYTEGGVTKNDTVNVIVDEAKLTSIVVLPTSMEIEAGNSDTITSVTAHYDNGTSAGIALSTCTYGSNNTSVTVANGVITVSSSCAATTAIITVSYTEGGVTKSDTVTVTVPASGG